MLGLKCLTFREGAMPDAQNRPIVEDLFQCIKLDRIVVLEHCLEYYREANAFRVSLSKCHECSQGWNNRHSFAHGLPMQGLVSEKELRLSRY